MDCILSMLKVSSRILLVQLLLDGTGVIDDVKDTKNQSDVRNIEMLGKRLCFTLHTVRYKRLNLIPKRNKKSRRKGSPGTQ